MWICKLCSAEVDDELELCWQCGASVDGEADPQFATESAADDSLVDAEAVPLQFSLRDVFLWTTVVAVVFAIGVPVVGQMFFGLTCTLLAFSLLGLFLWFCFWSLVYLLTGQRLMGRASQQRAAARAAGLPFDVWAKMQQTAPDEREPPG